MTRSSSQETSQRVLRFGGVERAVHWSNAVLFIFLTITGFSLYGAPGFRWIGYRGTVKDLHLWVGYALPFPVLFAILTRAGAQFRKDCKRFARWTVDDSRWWRKRTRPSAKLGKFNPGQKLNAIYIGACIIVFPVTGTAMRWANVFPLWMRRGADFTHSWFAIFLLAVILGHILMAITRPEPMRAILRGTVDAKWAQHEHPRWHAEMTTASHRRDSDPPQSAPTDPEKIGSGEIAHSS